MKAKPLIILFSLLVVFWACAPRKPLPPPPVPERPPEVRVTPDKALFEAAEALYQQASYEAAIGLYRSYVEQYPRGEAAPASLIRLGEVHTLSKEFDKTVDAYRQLVAQYPDHPFVPDAMIRIMDAYNRDEKFNETIQYSFEIPDARLSDEQRLEKESLLGDAFRGSGNPEDAVYFYSLVYDRADPPLKDQSLAQLKELLPQLSLVQATHLMSRLDDPVLRGHLLFELGWLNLEASRTEYAIEALSELVDAYPEHEQTPLAKDLLKYIFQSAIESPYTIGCLLPLSGPYKIYGNKALQGIEMAFAEHHAEHPQSPIRLLVKDTGSDPIKAVTAVQELAAANAAAIIGPIVTAEAAAVEAQYQGIPIILFTQKENITLTGPFVFRNFITPEMQVNELTAFAVRTLGLKRFAIFYPDENYGKTFMNLFWDALLDLGATVAGVESYPPDMTDFAEPIKKLVGLHYPIPEDLETSFELPPESTGDMGLDLFGAAEVSLFSGGFFRSIPELYYQWEPPACGPLATEEDLAATQPEEPEPIIDFQAVFIPDAPNKAGLIVPQLAFYDIEDVLLMGTNLWHSQKLLDMTRRYVQGAVMPDGFYGGSSASHVQAFADTFERTFDTPPGFIEGVAYDSARLVFGVLSGNNIRFRSRLKDELLNLVEFPGVTGKTSFDYKGEAIKKLYILKIRGNRFMELQTP